MTRYLGGLITKDESLVLPANNYEDTSAPGVWTLEEAQALNKQGLWPTAGVGNPIKFVENLFSVDVYTGNSDTQTITTGIDTSGEGGLVWIKSRSDSNHHQLYDTARGAGKPLYSSLTNSEGTNTDFASFTSTGFTLGYTSANGGVNGNSSDDYVSWTFRKAPKFFDVVTYTGSGENGQTINHNLGIAPGMVIVKSVSGSANWFVYHRSLSSGQHLKLGSTAAASSDSNYEIGKDTATATQFSIDTGSDIDYNGHTYVAYFFAHNTSSDGLIQCGTFNTDSSGDASVTLGFEPQWLMIKRSDGISNWTILDTMREWNDTTWNPLYADSSNAESKITSTRRGLPTATGFEFDGQLSASATYIYMAIRKAPMATPTSTASVFAKDFRFSSNAQAENPKLNYYSGFPVDFDLNFRRNSGGTYVYSRLQGDANFLKTDTNAAETANSADHFGSNKGLVPGFTNSEDTTTMSAMWRRAPGFFDVVVYTGNESSGRQITHNLGVAPEMIWIKERGGTSNWVVYHKGLNGGTDPHNYVLTGLNNGYDEAYNTAYFGAAPTSTTFTIGNNQANNESSISHIAYLFATLAGISKVGSFSHTNGSSTDVDCGFSSGSSFVIVKDRDQGSDSGDWYVWDSTRGIVSGNDPYLLLNSNAAEVTNTDYIDTLSSGFQIASGFATGDYIFYAIAA